MTLGDAREMLPEPDDGRPGGCLLWCGVFAVVFYGVGFLAWWLAAR